MFVPCPEGFFMTGTLKCLVGKGMGPYFFIP